MTPAARVAAAIEILDDILEGAPAERALTAWARRSRFAGSGDRLAIRDHVFTALRRRRSFAASGGAETGRGIMLGLLRHQGIDPSNIFTGEGHAPAVLDEAEIAWIPPELSHAERLDMPDWLYPIMVASLGPEAESVINVLQDRAPVFLRVNSARSSVSEVQRMLASDDIVTVPHSKVKIALEVTKNERKIKRSSAYLNGLIELQDASSQAAVLDLPLRDGQSVLDYCAGGGGKALAMAARADLTIVAHDIDPRRMADLPARAERAHAEITLASPDKLSGLFDLVFCDAPCSGSGTWRRAPDAKWRFTPERLTELTAIQDDVLTEANPYVAPDGVLAYATCSVLTCENDERVNIFLSRNPGWKLLLQRHFLPSDQGDGFYLALLKRA